jgi:choline-sulfatase
VSRAARHVVILVTVALCACLAAFGGWRFAKASAPVNGPIILISIDSLRADHLPAYGYTASSTPAIDALAADSIVFERAYSHVPQTLPAHAALLTGRLPFETGVRDSAGYALPASARTIAELLRDRGYKTGGIVSSFLLRKETGISRGFTFFDDERPSREEGGTELMRDGSESEQVAEHWLDSIGTSRAFLFLHLAEPHAPHQPPTRFDHPAPYDAEVAYEDESVGRFVKYLKSNQLYDSSTILLVSDHGEGLGDHGEQGHGFLPYEEELRVPLLIKQPGAEGAKRRVSTPVQHIDIVPTILSLAKAPGPGGLRGRSLTPLFSGGTVVEAPVYAESWYGAYRFGWRPLTSLSVDHFQLVSSGDHDQLFDLDTPPADRHDLADEHPEMVAALRKRLVDYASPVSPLKPTPVTATDRERFESLGYVGVPGTVAPVDSDIVDSLERVKFVEDYRAAVLRARTTDWKGALDAYRALTQVEPDMADLWLHLARTAARNERHDVALDAYRHVLALEPASASGHLGAATSFLRTRKFDDAAREAQVVLDDASTDSVQRAEGHELLARVALSHKDDASARTEAEAAEAADANRPVRDFVDGQLALREARYEDAVESFERALSAATKTGRPPLADLRVSAADALARLGRTEDAEHLLDAELTAYAANAKARSALQALYRANGRTRDAAALAKR